MDKIIIGTRGSKLALWQAYWIKDQLKAQGVGSEIKTIETKGDKILDTTIAKIGSKGVFTEEIEDQLKEGTIDIAVHSAKDLQSSLPEGFEIIAFTSRELTPDVLISHKKIDVNQPLLVGTSSTRRIAFLNQMYPHFSHTSVRGNLQTRIRKMEEGACDALLLAYAGVHRMGYNDKIVHTFDDADWISPVGQGSVAIEVYASLSKEKREMVRNACNDTNTELCLLAERAYLKELEGGCSIPVFARAAMDQNIITLEGGVVSLDGEERVDYAIQGAPSLAAELGKKMAEVVMSSGGKEILEEIKRSINN